MDDDEARRKPKLHEVGIGLDAMSVEELQARVVLLEGEIERLNRAIESRRKSRAAADTFFKS